MVYVGVLIKKNQNLGAKENIFPGKTYNEEREKNKKTACSFGGHGNSAMVSLGVNP